MVDDEQNCDAKVYPVMNVRDYEYIRTYTYMYNYRPLLVIHVHVVNKSELQRSKKDLLTARAWLRFESKPRKWITHARKKLLKITYIHV